MLPIRDHHRSGKFPLVTTGLIGLNALVFFAELATPNLDAFLRRWALVPALVDVSRPATLFPFVTSQFLHAGFAHILFNMWYLWIFGDNVEARFGRARFLGFAILSGVVAGLAQFFFLVGSPVPMLGASGAVAGVLGAYWALFPRHRIDTMFPYLWSRVTLPAGTVLLFWFIGQLFSGVGSLVAGGAETGGVAFWAHVGGFVFGWLVGRRAKRAPRALGRGLPD